MRNGETTWEALFRCCLVKEVIRKEVAARERLGFL